MGLGVGTSTISQSRGAFNPFWGDQQNPLQSGILIRWERKKGVKADEWTVRKTHGRADGVVEHPGWNGDGPAVIIVVYAALKDRERLGGLLSY